MKKTTITLAFVLCASLSYGQFLNTDRTGSSFNPALAGFDYSDQVNFRQNRTNSIFGVSNPVSNIDFSTFNEKHKIGWGVNYMGSHDSFQNWNGKTESFDYGIATLNVNKQFELGHERWLSAGLGFGGVFQSGRTFDYGNSESERYLDGDAIVNIGGAFRTKRFQLNTSVLGGYIDKEMILGLSLATSYSFGNEDGLQVIPQLKVNLNMPAASTAGVTLKYKSKFSLGGGYSLNYGRSGAYASIGYLYKEKIKFNYTFGIFPTGSYGNIIQHEFSIAFLLGKR